MNMKPTPELIEGLTYIARQYRVSANDMSCIKEPSDRLTELEALEKPEWFFRWASRAMASGDFKGAVETIFYHPANPYQKNNPWAQPCKHLRWTGVSDTDRHCEGCGIHIQALKYKEANHE